MESPNIFARAASGTGSHRGGGSNSLSGLISTLIPTLLVAIVVLVAFLILRPKVDRVYQPRSLDTFVLGHDKTPRSSGGMFGWVSNYRSLPDEFVLRHGSLDNFLFLRFFRMMVIIFFAGCCITWPILFPVNATGHGGQSQLDKLSFSNVAPSYRYFAHALVAWVFLGFVVGMVAFERFRFVGLRQAYFLSSWHAQRLSSRTVLFMGLPKDGINEAHIRQVFGPAIRKVWMVSDCNELEDKVKDRNKEYTRLESAEVKLITNSNTNRIKGKAPANSDSNEENASKWIDPKSRPTHRLKPIIGTKVDTIEHCRKSGPDLTKEIKAEQQKFLDGEGKQAPAVFVEFENQAAAQRAFQLMGLDKRSEYHPRYIGVNPNEIVWKNLGIGNASRKSKMTMATIFISLLVIFWAIPVAVVGAISNINYLTSKVHFLSFINKIPSVILGVVTGLLPVVLLAVLMALVPIICRALAKLAGEPTLSAIELRTQSWYFAFQLIQVFLITTFTSAASSVVAQIVQDPTLATSLLATNLPKASNFYIDYFLLFGLSASAMTLLNVVPFVMLTIVGKFLDKTPRKQYNRWLSLGGLGWGSVYPVYTNLGVIAITYACIAPLILAFAGIGLGLLYLAFRYNLLFTLGNKVDTKGETYARALKQLMSGVYIATLCLIGLFAIGTAKSSGAIGPLVLMIIFLVCVIIFQILLDRALAPMERKLPFSLLDQNEKSTKLYSLAEKGNNRAEEEPKEVDRIDGQEQLDDGATNVGSDHELPHWKAPTHLDESETKPSFLTKLAKPYVTKSYESNKALLAGSEAAQEVPEYQVEDINEAYHNPAITAPQPLIWLARDEMGMSKMFATENQEVGIETVDDGASYNEKGKIVWDHENVTGMPIWKEVVRARRAQQF